MRTFKKLCRRLPGEGCGFCVRSVPVSIVLASQAPWFRGKHRTRLEKVLLTDSRLFDIQPETSCLKNTI